MPELPEVQTTVTQLRPNLVGRIITGVWTDPGHPTKTGSGPGWPKIKRSIIGRRITNVERRAKYIVVKLDSDDYLYIHQKMSGHLLYGHWQKTKKGWQSTRAGILSEDPKNGYLRSVFSLDDGAHCALSDMRRFGTILLVQNNQVAKHPELARLGPEPLTISAREFSSVLSARRGRLKEVLMNPQVIAGIGNIYADEILWKVGLDPRSRVENLSATDHKALYTATRTILNKAVKHQGSSTDDYRTPAGAQGSFQLLHRAYHQHGQACQRRDGGTIMQIRLAQRSAHFCPVHQLKK